MLKKHIIVDRNRKCAVNVIPFLNFNDSQTLIYSQLYQLYNKIKFTPVIVLNIFRDGQKGRSTLSWSFKQHFTAN